MLTPGSSLRLSDGSELKLGPVLAKAGEGTIYEAVDHPDWAVKIFHTDLKDLAEKCAKVAAMVCASPSGATQSDGFVVLTWPRAVVVDDNGPRGYVMARVDTANAVEIHSVSNPDDRNRPLPSAPQWTPKVTWMHLVNIAANLCLAVEAVHQVDAVIGDFQERNILVADTTQVTLVDCDSMQFTEGDGNQFLCGVGRPEFTAPELVGQDLSSTVRAKTSDLFALAVHIHLLLMAGNHPFLRGQWTGAGEQPDALTLAGSGQWAGGPNSALHCHPLAPPVSFLPGALARLFVRAFTDGAANPDSRPTAAEWRSALRAVTFGTCSRGHQIPLGSSPCPWCGIEDERAQRRAARAVATTPASPTTYAEAYAGHRSSTFAGSTTAVGDATPSKDKRTFATAVVAGGTIGVAVLVALFSGQSDDSGGSSASTWTPTSTWTSTSTWTPTTTRWAPTETAVAPGESSGEAIRNASVGDCIVRVLGASQGNGVSNVTVSRVTCSSRSATDKVIARYSTITDCSTGDWVRDVTNGVTTVLCLTKQ